MIVSLACFVLPIVSVLVWLYLARLAIGESLIKHFHARKPDLTLIPVDLISLNRWHVIPRNRFFNIYLHQHVGDDDPRAMHNHPWWSISFLLRNAYFDIVPLNSKNYNGFGRLRAIRRQAGDVVIRSPRDAHRLVMPGPEKTPCWSLFVTGPRVGDWGFWVAGKGWVPEGKYRTLSGGISTIKPSND